MSEATPDPVKLANYGELFEEEDKGYLWWNAYIDGADRQREYAVELLTDMMKYTPLVVYSVFRGVAEGEDTTEEDIVGLVLDSVESFTKAVNRMAAHREATQWEVEIAKEISLEQGIEYEWVTNAHISDVYDDLIKRGVRAVKREARDTIKGKLLRGAHAVYAPKKGAEPDTSSLDEDIHVGTRGATVAMVEKGLSRVEESKENIREFFRQSPVHPQSLELIEPIIETFGWIYPTDTVITCANVLLADHQINRTLRDKLIWNWNNLKFSGGPTR